MTTSIRIRGTVVQEFIAEGFQCLGVGRDDAWVAADVLVRADLRGVESHGVNNLWQYVDPLRDGTLNPRPEIKVLRSSPVLASVVVDILTGVLGGGTSGNSFLRNPPEDEKLRTSSSHFFAALRVDMLQPIEEFKAAMDDMLRALKESKKADGQDRIYTHGEIGFEAEQERLRDGIPYHPALVAYLRELASESNVRLDV